ncbi:MAG: hypothetical protein HYW89_02490 [Candidatus Sungiibacteriota bacterium]|uniref:Uncharacterized protein n=1 Tax=Candidatus Sungiibacteriota bacterium TaxID=2750080 RepID=A0A7T5RKD7_9BACT|nr:MAG: hypothetical protein HYW89_02490 [Candidatus Sungbacteria bacterium]
MTISSWAAADNTVFTPDALIKTLKIIDVNPQVDSDNNKIMVVFAGDDLRNRKIIVEHGETNYFSGLWIGTFPVSPEKESEAWSWISYEIGVSEEPLNIWRTTKRNESTETKQHIWFIFKVNLLIPTNELADYLKDYQTKPLRRYEGVVSYKIFKVRRDIRGIPIEDFEQGAETIYVEIEISVVKIDGRELKIPSPALFGK